MEDFSVVDYLKSKGLHGRSVSGGSEYLFPCVFDCGEDNYSKNPKLYVNVESGFFHCPRCGTSGGSYLVQRHFGDTPTGDDSVYRRGQILDAATRLAQKMLAANPDVIERLMADRGLTLDSIVDHRLGYIPPRWSLSDSLSDTYSRQQLLDAGLVQQNGRDVFAGRITIPIIASGHVVAIRGRAFGNSGGPKYLSAAGDAVRIYNVDALREARECLLVEGELDTMAVAQHLAQLSDERARGIAVIGVPGTSAIPDDLVDRLAEMKRVFVGFDSDTAGRKGAQRLVEKIGGRAKQIEIPDPDTDWSEWLTPARPDDPAWMAAHPEAGHTGVDVLRLITAASGRRIFSVAEFGRAYRELKVAKPGLKTGWPALDKVLAPGMLPGQVMVYLGKTGTSKTIFTLNMIYRMRARRILLLSLELTGAECYMRLERIYLTHHPFATQAELEFAFSSVMICDENRVASRQFTDIVDEYEEEMGAPPEMVALDYLGYWVRGQPGASPYEKANNGIMYLKEAGKARQFCIFTPSQLSKGAKDGVQFDVDDARDSGVIGETADFALGAWRPDRERTNGGRGVPDGRLMVEFLKCRHGGAGTIIPMRLDLVTLTICEESEPYAQIAKSHNEASLRSWTWEDYRAEILAPHQTIMEYQ